MILLPVTHLLLAESICHTVIISTKKSQRLSHSGQNHSMPMGSNIRKHPTMCGNFIKRKNDTINDYLHKCTRYIVSYCKCNDIHTVVIGNITNIRKDNSLGSVTNQKLHSLPYNKIYIMLEYKLVAEGICFVKQKESYSSQCSPLMPIVSKKKKIMPADPTGLSVVSIGTEIIHGMQTVLEPSIS